MTERDLDLKDTSEPTVDGGCLPNWEVADLPAPPPFRFGKAFRVILGPGIIALGGSIGSGEWLLGPAITARYGGSLLWIATVAILLQSFVNTEAIRYTLYTGEPMFTGYMRCKPGPRFWAFFYKIISFFGIWPGWAATAATALAAMWLSYTRGGGEPGLLYMPGEADQSTVRFFAYLIFFACLGIVLFGKKIYNALEKVQLWMVVWILGYLICIDLFLVPPKVWWTVIKGFLGISALQQQGGAEIDWVLLGAFAAYAGSGGLGNIGITHYVRDKGWGMSSLVGAIPSLVGGKQITLSHIGKVFRMTPENLERFRQWWKYNRFEQYGIWVVGCFLGLSLPAMLTIAFVPLGQEVDQWSAAAFQAGGLAQKAGPIFGYLTLLCGFWVLFSTQLGGVDGVPRSYTDTIWTGFASARKLEEHHAKWIYYPIVVFYILWGILALYFAKPFFMILVSATIGGFLLVISSLHTLYVNRTLLPKEIQPPLWRQLGLALCAVFYATFGILAANKLIESVEVKELIALPFGLIVLVSVVLILVAGWDIFTKAGQPGWASLIPIYNLYIMLKIAGKPSWWWILLCIPLVNVVFLIIACVGLAKSFGKSKGFAVGLVLLPPIFVPILGFGSAEYVGKSL